MSEVINFVEKFSRFSSLWEPKVVAEMNDYQFKLVKVKGEFIRHQHDDTDEVFIDFDHERKSLSAGEMIVVPKGVNHRPSSEDECHVLLVEPSGVVNTGDAGGDLTAPNDAWI
jgi:mannose-6-phosphate isomerase-like protein (cupin superfamily)